MRSEGRKIVPTPDLALIAFYTPTKNARPFTPGMTG